ncbi:tetratricopeptide repeat protein [uncultured Cohaesibacter sp.]|uniref:tetratricopeptide repeat protein n=1 Tax=uncultured Cohaesibacter sp. TaxID=1002546 RepID=UPI0029C8B709|nr:tetratricopeptide repeat protein [uncultured Cohaesibacter sp.]
MHFSRSTKLLRQFLLSSVVGTGILLAPVQTGQAQPETVETVVQALEDMPTTLAGTYLAARVAQEEGDLTLAAHFYALALEKDPENPQLLERNFALAFAVGQHDVAFSLAERMAEKFGRTEAEVEEGVAENATEADDDPSAEDLYAEQQIAPMVHMALGVKALKGKNYASASKSFEAGLDKMINNPVDLLRSLPFRGNLNNPALLSASAQNGPFALISQSVLNAWSLIGQDRKNLDKALKAMESINSSEVNQFFFSLHSGLIAAYAKDYAKAADYLQKSLQADPNSVATADALINVYLKAGNTDKAKETLALFALSAADTEEKDWLRATYGEMTPVASPIRTPQDGAAELFSTLGDALTQEDAIEGGALYLQYADYLRPNHDRTEFALGRLFERMKRDDTALEYFDQIPESSYLYRKAQRRAGFSLTRLKRADDAIDRLSAMLDGDASDLETVSVLSRIYQSEDRFQDSINLLTRGLDSVKTKRDIHWSLYFLRGSAYDQIKDWPNTEKDMQEALELFPNQPTVLNYLGYSWVDRGLHLDKAIEMIRQAVALKPYDGFFVDSLGWAYYRLNKFEDAVEHLERAVELRPEDPTITDHLGDAYWKAGRQNEAYFQWKRVKTMQPTDELMKQVDEKIEKGLVD